ncbi:GNAT family N-acetyltransferase [archaeon]|jgi:ribosomal protein S18 acetylase RimI-like enzyme|nr:GNAT family N-acetyltransferase [archaeon]
MKIIKATKRDSNEISKIFLEESNKKPYSQNYSPKTIKSRVKDMLNFGSIYLAITDKEITGFIAIAGEGKSNIYIDEFWIKKRYQRKGTGTEMLKFVQNKYKKKGAKSISVMTSKKAKAFRFYKKIGFQKNNDEIILNKKLK